MRVIDPREQHARRLELLAQAEAASAAPPARDWSHRLDGQDPYARRGKPRCGAPMRGGQKCGRLAGHKIIGNGSGHRSEAVVDDEARRRSGHLRGMHYR